MGVVIRRSVKLIQRQRQGASEGLGRPGWLRGRPPQRMRATVPESLPADHVTSPSPAPAAAATATAPSQPRHPRPMFKASEVNHELEIRTTGEPELKIQILATLE
ncbi:unnamed protein product, partial [Iphiclides podalirius]